MKTLLLNKQDVEGLISIKEVIATVEEAYKAFNSGQVIQPAYTCIHLPPPRGEIDFKLGYCEANEIISMKASSGGFPNNPIEHSVPSGMECHLVSGGYDYLLRFLTRGVNHYQQIIEGLLERNIGIEKYFSYIVIKSPFIKTHCPIERLFPERAI